MIDERELLEREVERFTPEPGMLERVALRRERKQRRQRLSAGALGVVIAVAVIAGAVATLRSQEPVPGDNTSTPPPPTQSSSPPTQSALPEPLVKLDPGYHFVDVRTGESTPLPVSITAVEGAGNFDVSPDGSMILFDNASLWAASDEPVELGLHQLYVANIDGSDLHQLTDDPVGASQGSWSPDGTKVVYLGGWAKLCCYANPADLTVLDLETGTSTRGAHGPAKDFQDPFFSADGNEILVTRVDPSHAYVQDQPQDDLWTIPVSGGHLDPLLEDRGNAVVSPDGASIVYQRIVYWQEGNTGGSFSEMWISDADGSHPRLLVPATHDHPGAVAAGGWSPDGARIAYTQLLRSYTTRGVFVLDIESGNRTFIAFGSAFDWLDDRTVLIKAGRGGEE